MKQYDKLKSQKEKIMEIKDLSLLTLTNCPHCHTAKIFLKKYNVNYKEINWDDKENEKIFEELKISHVPVLLVPSETGLKKIEGEVNINNWARSL